MIGHRQQCLLPYTAIGAVRTYFEYDSENGATMERLSGNWRGSKFEASEYCNGGCAWAGVRNCVEVHVITRYTGPVLMRHEIGEGTPAAVVAQRLGRGVSVHSGVHPEMNEYN